MKHDSQLLIIQRVQQGRNYFVNLVSFVHQGIQLAYGRSESLRQVIITQLDP